MVLRGSNRFWKGDRGKGRSRMCWGGRKRDGKGRVERRVEEMAFIQNLRLLRLERGGKEFFLAVLSSILAGSRKFICFPASILAGFHRRNSKHVGTMSSDFSRTKTSISKPTAFLLNEVEHLNEINLGDLREIR